MSFLHRSSVIAALLLLSTLTKVAVAQATNGTVFITDQNGKSLDRAVITITSASIASETLPPEIHLMDQVNKRFVPDVIAINKGDSIRFPNSDGIRHHVYSFSVPLTFELPLYSGEPKNPMQFPEVGMVVVGCNIHDRMTGYIYITEKARHLVTIDGKAEFKKLPSEKLTLTVYHPDAINSPALTLEVQAADLATMKPLKIALKQIAPEKADATMSELDKKFQSLRHAKH